MCDQKSRERKAGCFPQNGQGVVVMSSQITATVSSCQMGAVLQPQREMRVKAMAKAEYFMGLFLSKFLSVLPLLSDHNSRGTYSIATSRSGYILGFLILGMLPLLEPLCQIPEVL